MASMMLYRRPVSSPSSAVHCSRRACHFSTELMAPSFHRIPHIHLSLNYHKQVSVVHLHPRRSSVVRAAGVSSSLSPQRRVETDFLPSDVRELTMKAVDELDGRVTVGDVASRAGIKVSQAETALQALATDSGGFLEVSNEGDVLYVFPKDYRSILATKSVKLKFEPILGKLKAAADYLIRVSFGTALLVSIMLVYSTLMVLITSSRSENDNRQGSNRSYGSGFSIYISPADLFWYSPFLIICMH
ncbi:hypothetical protein KP509_02G009900 [Ceratopteris richardii]|uniref:Iron-sulfur cluster biosynthesis family protein n=1 Tax=Ceratopteris richardii TaxID=49495 RepID=A0A8T2VET1_CERRI|nr:hypothetical protein KP509_02G009900 [Ceratopteris richardii]